MSKRRFWDELNPIEIETLKTMQLEFTRFAIKSVYSGDAFTQKEVLMWFLNAQAHEKLKIKLALGAEHEIQQIMMLYRTGHPYDQVLASAEKAHAEFCEEQNLG